MIARFRRLSISISGAAKDSVVIAASSVVDNNMDVIGDVFACDGVRNAEEL